MKKHLFMLALPVLFLAAGCNDDDHYSLGKVWGSFATVENPDRENVFFFTTDGGNRMWTAGTDLRGYHPKDGQRVFVYYTILSDKSPESTYDHDVVLRDVYNILTKNVVEITGENNEELGNDPIRVSDIWVGSDYLNIEFFFGGQYKTHYINLGSDASKEYGDGKIHLELRHNANGDVPSRTLWGIVSFDLKPLQSQGSDPLTLVIHTLPSEGGEDKMYEVIYHFDGRDVPLERTLSVKEDEFAEIE